MTPRILSGHQIGLLPRDNDEQVPFAYKLYKRTDNEGLDLAAGFKQTFCSPVTIDFLGVWSVIRHLRKRDADPPLPGTLSRASDYFLVVICHSLPRTRL